jgi:hypothetical protein
MKHITIKIGSLNDARYDACVKSQRAWLDMEYECIDNIRAIQLLTEANDKYGGVNSVDEIMEKPYIAPDYIRCYALSLQPEILYCDSDVEIFDIPPDFRERPGMEFHPHTELHNTGIIWNGNRPDIFGELCRYWFTQKQVQYFYGSMAKAAKDNNFDRYEATGSVAPAWFRHYMYGMLGGYR